MRSDDWDSSAEKVLKANGYTKGNDSNLRDLQKRIDAAAADGVITDARRKKRTKRFAISATMSCMTIGEQSRMTR